MLISTIAKYFTLNVPLKSKQDFHSKKNAGSYIAFYFIPLSILSLLQAFVEQKNVHKHSYEVLSHSLKQTILS